MDDRWIRALYRARSKALCRIGRHLWATRRNPAVGGRDAVFQDCRRCGKDRPQYDPPSVRMTSGYGQ
jgi:hypothetical protein